MITTNVFQRTFQFSFGESQGTCFTVDHDNRQYIVTARHLVERLTDSATIKIKHEEVWKDCLVNLVGHCEGKIDISVLAAGFQISPTYTLPTSAGGITLGQDVYFIGFPYGIASEIGELNRNFPLPFVKKATFSASTPKLDILFLDGHNNPGFSGGPVVFSEVGKTG